MKQLHYEKEIVLYVTKHRYFSKKIHQNINLI